MKRLSLAICLLFAPGVFAEVVQIPIGQQGDQTIERPTLGMSKEEVEKRFGEPVKWTEAKGQPPISSWDYPKFKVYFEGERVIHSVVKHTEKKAD
jgi:hypothetical protein